MANLYYETSLAHSGKGHDKGGHSGRYPWGSGDRPYQSIKGGAGKVSRTKKPPHDDYVRAHSKESTKALSDKELNQVVNRLNREKEYNKLVTNSSPSKKAQKIVKTAITGAATATLTKYANKYAKKGMKVVEELVLSKVADKVEYEVGKKIAEAAMIKIMREEIRKF